MTVEQKFLFSLHEQLFDLQEYVYNGRFVQEKEIYSNYFHLIFTYKLYNETVRNAVDKILNILFQNRYILKPIFGVWKWNTLFEDEHTVRVKIYIFYENATTISNLKSNIKHTHQNIELDKIIIIKDSFQFLQMVKDWTPIPHFLYHTQGCEAWYRFIHPISPTYTKDGVLFTLSSNYHFSEELQRKFKEEWDFTTLTQLIEIDNFYDE